MMILLGVLLIGSDSPVNADNARLVRVTFVNNTRNVRTLIIYTADGRNVVGSFAQGGRLGATIPIYDGDASFDVYWEASGMSGSFTITPDMPDYLRIVLTSRGPIGPTPIEGG